MQLNELTSDGQAALVAWAVLAKACGMTGEDLTRDEVDVFVEFGLNRALGDVCKSVGIRGHRPHNNMRRSENNPRDIRKKMFKPTKNRKVNV